MSPVDPLLTEVDQRVAELDALGRRADTALLHGCRRVIKELIINNTQKRPPTEFLKKIESETWGKIEVIIGKTLSDPNRDFNAVIEDAKQFLVSNQEKWQIFIRSGAGIVDTLDLPSAVDFFNDFKCLGLRKCVEKWRKRIGELPEARAK
jgi:hypothetical protein